jgi:hypothetical protein
MVWDSHSRRHGGSTQPFNEHRDSFLWVNPPKRDVGPHFYLAPWLRTSGVIPLFPSCVFMACVAQFIFTFFKCSYCKTLRPLQVGLNCDLAFIYRPQSLCHHTEVPRIFTSYNKAYIMLFIIPNKHEIRLTFDEFLEQLYHILSEYAGLHILIHIRGIQIQEI